MAFTFGKTNLGGTSSSQLMELLSKQMTPKPKANILERIFALPAAVGSIPDVLYGMMYRNRNPFKEYLGNLGEGVKSLALGEKVTDRKTTSDILKMAGMTGTDPVSKGVRGVLGFAGDVALDPMTYVSFGTIGLGKNVASQTIKEGVEKAGVSLADDVAKQATEVLAERGVKEFTTEMAGKLTPEVIQQVGQVAFEKGLKNQRILKLLGKELSRSPAVVTGVEAVANPVGLAVRGAGAGLKRIAPEAYAGIQKGFADIFSPEKFAEAAGEPGLLDVLRKERYGAKAAYPIAEAKWQEWAKRAEEMTPLQKKMFGNVTQGQLKVKDELVNSLAKEYIEKFQPYEDMLIKRGLIVPVQNLSEKETAQLVKKYGVFPLFVKSMRASGTADEGSVIRKALGLYVPTSGVTPNERIKLFNDLAGRRNSVKLGGRAGIASHEIGHAIERMLPKNTLSELRAEITSVLSGPEAKAFRDDVLKAGNAEQNFGETLAETFRTYSMGGNLHSEKLRKLIEAIPQTTTKSITQRTGMVLAPELEAMVAATGDSTALSKEWAGLPINLKKDFDTALFAGDAPVVQKLLPQIPEYYKQKWQKEIATALSGEEIPGDLARLLKQDLTPEPPGIQAMGAKTASDITISDELRQYAEEAKKYKSAEDFYHSLSGRAGKNLGRPPEVGEVVEISPPLKTESTGAYDSPLWFGEKGIRKYNGSLHGQFEIIKVNPKSITVKRISDGKKYLVDKASRFSVNIKPFIDAGITDNKGLVDFYNKSVAKLEPSVTTARVAQEVTKSFEFLADKAKKFEKLEDFLDEMGKNKKLSKQATAALTKLFDDVKAGKEVSDIISDLTLGQGPLRTVASREVQMAPPIIKDLLPRAYLSQEVAGAYPDAIRNSMTKVDADKILSSPEAVRDIAKYGAVTKGTIDKVLGGEWYQAMPFSVKGKMQGHAMQRTYENLIEGERAGWIYNKDWDQIVAKSAGRARSAAASYDIAVDLHNFVDSYGKKRFFTTAEAKGLGGGSIPNTLKMIEFKGTGIRYYTDSDSYKLLKQYSEHLLTDSGTKRLFTTYDKVLSSWKGMVTGLGPGFIGYNVRNAIGDMFNMVMDGHNVVRLPGNVAEAGKVVDFDHIARQGDGLEAARSKYGKEVENIWKRAWNSGTLTEYGQQAEESGIRSALNMPEQNSVLDKLKKGYMDVVTLGGKTHDRENLMRVAHFIEMHKQTNSWSSAAEAVRRVLFNYDELTQTEREVFKRVIPFYTWMRKNFEFHLNNYASNPNRYAVYRHLIENVQKNFGADMSEEDWAALPDWMKSGLAIVTGRKGDTVSVLTSLGLPLESIQNLLGKGPGDTLRQLMGMTAPPIKIAMELGTGQNLFTKRPIIEETYGGRYQKYPPWMKSLLGYKEQEKVSKTGEKYTKMTVDPVASYILANIPYVSGLSTQYKRGAEAAADPMYLLSLLSGGRMYKRNLSDEEEARQREAIKRLQEILARKGYGSTYKGYSLTKAEQQELLNLLNE